MATTRIVLNDVSVRVDGTTLTEQARSVSIPFEADELDATGFGGDGWRQFSRGLKAGTIEVEFYNGFDSNGVHATLWDLFDDGSEFEVRIGPAGDSGDTDNPVLVAPCVLNAYNFLQGEVGALSMNPVTFRITGAPTFDVT